MKIYNKKSIRAAWLLTHGNDEGAEMIDHFFDEAGESLYEIIQFKYDGSILQIEHDASHNLLQLNYWTLIVETYLDLMSSDDWHLKLKNDGHWLPGGVVDDISHYCEMNHEGGDDAVFDYHGTYVLQLLDLFKQLLK